MFTHHKLNVYQKALDLGAGAEALSAGWGKRRAIADYFLDWYQQKALPALVETAPGREVLGRITAMLSRF